MGSWRRGSPTGHPAREAKAFTETYSRCVKIPEPINEAIEPWLASVEAVRLPLENGYFLPTTASNTHSFVRISSIGQIGDNGITRYCQFLFSRRDCSIPPKLYKYPYTQAIVDNRKLTRFAQGSKAMQQHREAQLPLV